MITSSRSKLSGEIVEAVNFTCPFDVPNNEPRTRKFRTPPFEVEYEEYTPNSTGPKKRWKDFQHYRSSVVSTDRASQGSIHTTQRWVGLPKYHIGVHTNPYWGYSYDDSSTGVEAYGRFGSNGRLDLGLPAMYVKAADGGFVPAPAQLSALLGKGYKTILPSIKADLSVVNSLLELRDFKSVPRTLRSILELLKQLKDFRHLGSLGTKTLRQFFRVSADAYLQKEFNIGPLLSDISGIKTALQRNERRMNDLVTRSGRTQCRHFAYNFVPYSDAVETTNTYLIHELPGSYDSSIWASDSAGVYTCKNDRIVKYGVSKFHMQIEYNFNYTQYLGLHAGLLSFLDRIGLNLNPAIIWNAIPWSFVVDWVFGVSRWLDQFKVPLLKPLINIHRALWSVTYARRIYVANRVGYAHSSDYVVHSPVVQLPVVNQTAYRRQTFTPEASSIVSSGLSSHEFSLGAALVLARRKRRKQ